MPDNERGGLPGGGGMGLPEAERGTGGGAGLPEIERGEVPPGGPGWRGGVGRGGTGRSGRGAPGRASGPDAAGRTSEPGSGRTPEVGAPGRASDPDVAGRGGGGMGRWERGGGGGAAGRGGTGRSEPPGRCGGVCTGPPEDSLWLRMGREMDSGCRARLSGAASSGGCAGRRRPAASARRRILSACASSMLEEWLFTPMPSSRAKSRASLLLSPSSRASS